MRLPEPSDLVTSELEEFICGAPNCGQPFSTRRKLASHLKAHSAGSQCPLCPEVVRYLGPHLRREHADDDLVKLERMITELVDEVRSLRAAIPRKPGL
jgi:hypothetical protein